MVAKTAKEDFMAKILFFGPLREIMGVKEHVLDFEEGPLLRSDLVKQLAEGQQTVVDELGSASVRIIADNAIVADDFDLSGSSEIAFLPPMSGG